MLSFQLGLVHTPVTPFTRDHGIDFDRLGELLTFHIRHGAEALALLMHAAESVSLAEDEKRSVLAFAVKECDGQVPIIAHVSNSGTAIAATLARDAEDIGVAAIVATTPYYWTPPPAMVLEHFTQIGAAVRLPFFVLNAPEDMAGSKVSSDLMLKLIARLDNFAGLIDAGLDWQFLIELMTDAPRARPGFQLVAGTEHLVSASAIGASGMFSSLASIAPRQVRALYDACRGDKLFEARSAQEALGALRHAMKPLGAPSLKAALHLMGRDCGGTRTPLSPLNESKVENLRAKVESLLGAEPRGWN
jgi:4-hydroxy-tetrahydrodipicolinate synthase